MNEPSARFETAKSLLAALGARPAGPIVVLAPHPDDEIFALGGFMSMVETAGFAVEIVGITDGEASHRASKRISPGEMRAVRMAETGAAYAALHLLPKRTVLRLPDGGVGPAFEQLKAGLSESLAGAALCLAPLEFDGHPDHEAVGAAALEVCAELGTPLAMYGVWSRFEAQPAESPGVRFELALDPDTLDLKRRAMSCYQSQLRALGPLPEDGPVLFDGFLEPFSEPTEVLWKRV